MSDIGLTWNLERGAADLRIASNDLVIDDGLETAVLLSLFCDRRVDGLPDPRGWWGDAFPIVDGDKWGSRLWTLARSTQNEVLQQSPEIIREALAWMIEDKVATKVDVEAILVRSGVVAWTIRIYKPISSVVNYRYQFTWAAQAAQRG